MLFLPPGQLLHNDTYQQSSAFHFRASPASVIIQPGRKALLFNIAEIYVAHIALRLDIVSSKRQQGILNMRRPALGAANQIIKPTRMLAQFNLELSAESLFSILQAQPRSNTPASGCNPEPAGKDPAPRPAVWYSTDLPIPPTPAN